MKNGLEWFRRRGTKKLPEDETSLSQELLSYAPIQKHCRGLWESLTQAEQHCLQELGHPSAEDHLVDQLQTGGIIVHGPDGWHLFSPLWQTYLVQHVWSEQQTESMQVESDPATRRVVLRWRGRTAETEITRRLVFELLQVLSMVPGKVYSKDEIIRTIYEEDEAQEVLDDALFQLVTALRRSLDEPVRRLCPEMTASCIQNVRGVGYRLIADLPASGGPN